MSDRSLSRRFPWNKGKNAASVPSLQPLEERGKLQMHASKELNNGHMNDLLANSPSFHGQLHLQDIQSPTESVSTEESTKQAPRNVPPGDVATEPDHLIHNHARLPKAFRDVLLDTTALGFFVEYLDSVHQRKLLKFWHECEKFRQMALQKVMDLDHERNSGNDSGVCSTNQIFSPSAASKIDHEEVVAIFSKYLSKESTQSIGISDKLRDEVVNRICTKNDHVDPSCFESAQEFVMHALEKRYFPAFLDSVFYLKLQLEVYTSEKVSLADILFNEAVAVHFFEFMEQENAENLASFIKDAEHFREFCQRAIKSQQYNADAIQSDAMVLYDKYFSMQATNSLKFDDSIRFDVENEICREGGPTPDCFDKPVRLVLQKLQNKYLPKYLRSVYHVQYLSEMIAKISKDSPLPLPKPHGHFRSSSAAGFDVDAESSSNISDGADSIHSCPLQTTGNSPDPQAKRRQNQVRHISVDSFDLNFRSLDPNSIWQRPDSEKSLGEVDAFGNYHRRYDEDNLFMTSAKESKVKKAFTKLFHKREKEQEELAAKVAQLIIKDIQQMTANAEQF